MTYEDIRQTITARMASFSAIDQARIQYPNQPAVFEPPDTGLWCRLNIQHASAFMAGMADRPYTRKPGQIVVQCFAQVRTGIKALNELADALESHFSYWSSGELECIETGQIDAGESEGFYQINVVTRFRAG
jgi:hypothetical protein